MMVKKTTRLVRGTENVRIVETSTGDRPHSASRYDAGTGQGTVRNPHYESRTLDHPVLDGATESPRSQAATMNPYRGYVDPERIHPRRQQDK